MLGRRIILIGGISLCASTFAHVPIIKVLIAKDQKSLLVQGPDLVKNIYPINQTKSYQGQKTIRFDCIPSGQKYSNHNKPILVAGISSSTGLITWNKNTYRGELLLLTGAEQKNCDLVNQVSIDAYISSLLAKEMNGTWPIEALKAQAVAARSYALQKIKSKEVSNLSGFETYYDVESSEKHQVYGTYADETGKTNSATLETKGEVLISKKGNLVPIFFHSKCGGKTLLPQDVWGGIVEDYKSVDCPFCHKSGPREWRADFDKRTFHSAIQSVLSRYNFNPKAKKSSNRITIAPDQRSPQLMIYTESDGKQIRKASIRDILGRSRLPSNNFKIQRFDNKIKIEGIGNGHGVGMCQFGALEMAKRGYNYKQILHYYYPNFKLAKAYR